MELITGESHTHTWDEQADLLRKRFAKPGEKFVSNIVTYPGVEGKQTFKDILADMSKAYEPDYANLRAETTQIVDGFGSLLTSDEAGNKFGVKGSKAAMVYGVPKVKTQST